MEEMARGTGLPPPLPILDPLPDMYAIPTPILHPVLLPETEIEMNILSRRDSPNENQWTHKSPLASTNFDEPNYVNVLKSCIPITPLTLTPLTASGTPSGLLRPTFPPKPDPTKLKSFYQNSNIDENINIDQNIPFQDNVTKDENDHYQEY